MTKGVLVAALSVVCAACAPPRWRATFSEPEQLTIDEKAPFLKVHMIDGSLYVLSDWKVSVP